MKHAEQQRRFQSGRPGPVWKPVRTTGSVVQGASNARVDDSGLADTIVVFDDNGTTDTTSAERRSKQFVRERRKSRGDEHTRGWTDNTRGWTHSTYPRVQTAVDFHGYVEDMQSRGLEDRL